MLPHLLHLSPCSHKCVYTCRCWSAVMSMTVAVSVLVADVNELLKTIWQVCVCVYMMLHAALEASWTRLILWLPFLTLSLWRTSYCAGSGAVNAVHVSVWCLEPSVLNLPVFLVNAVSLLQSHKTFPSTSSLQFVPCLSQHPSRYCTQL